MNFKRKHFLFLVDCIKRGEIKMLIIAHQDRLMCFGFELVNQESLSPQQEMVEDLMASVHTFSCRLYGMRKYQKDIQHDFPQFKLAPVKEQLQ